MMHAAAEASGDHDSEVEAQASIDVDEEHRIRPALGSRMSRVQIQHRLLLMETGACIVGEEYSCDVRFFRKCFSRLDMAGTGQVSRQLIKAMLVRLGDALEMEREPLVSKADRIDVANPTHITWDGFRKSFDFKVKLGAVERIFLTFDDPSCSTLSWIIGFFVMMLIVCSCAVLILETDPSYKTASKGSNEEPKCTHRLCDVFTVVDTFSIIVFTVEYVMRLMTAHAVRKALSTSPSVLVDLFCGGDSDMRHIGMEGPSSEQGSEGGCHGLPAPCRTPKWRKTLAFVLQPSNLIDLVAILPWYVQQAYGSSDGASFNVLRAVRLTRIFKMSRYNEVLQITDKVMKSSAEPLSVICFYLAMGIIISGSMLYYAELGDWEPPSAQFPYGAYMQLAQPVVKHTNGTLVRTPSKFTSIPISCWWVLVTITTVGYGDMQPTTTMGRLLATATMVGGLILLAMPIGVIGSNFSNELHNFKKEKQAVRDEMEREWLQEMDAEADKGEGQEPQPGGKPAAESKKPSTDQEGVKRKVSTLSKMSLGRLRDRKFGITVGEEEASIHRELFDHLEALQQLTRDKDPPNTSLLPASGDKGARPAPRVGSRDGPPTPSTVSLAPDSEPSPGSADNLRMVDPAVQREWQRVRQLLEGPLVEALPEADREAVWAQAYAAGLSAKAAAARARELRIPSMGAEAAPIDGCSIDVAFARVQAAEAEFNHRMEEASRAIAQTQAFSGAASRPPAAGDTGTVGAGTGDHPPVQKLLR